MSRIGLKPIENPAGVDVKGDGTTVTVKGPKGELTRNVHPNMAVAVEGNEVIVKRPNDEKENKSLHGLTRHSLLLCPVSPHPGFRFLFPLFGTFR